MLQRTFTKRLISPGDIQPLYSGMKVVSTFNPGAIDLGDGDVLLLVRVAEIPAEQRAGMTALPRHEIGGELTIDWLPGDTLDTRDPRFVIFNDTGLYRLTVVSYLLAIRLKGGIDVVDEPIGCLAPSTEYETFGIEDPRITKIDERFYITYVAVSKHGCATALASTTDFIRYERHGVIFPPENKDVVLFPETIAGRYVAMHRPNPNSWFNTPEIWLADSPDLVSWGNHRVLLSGGESDHDSGRIGGGTPPIRTDRGWLTIYHGNDKKPGEERIGAYVGSALLLDLDDPSKILARSPGPIIAPQEPFEKNGFVGDVVFPTGIVERGDVYWIYYGAADEYCGVLGIRRDDLMRSVGQVAAT